MISSVYTVCYKSFNIFYKIQHYLKYTNFNVYVYATIHEGLSLTKN